MTAGSAMPSARLRRGGPSAAGAAGCRGADGALSASCAARANSPADCGRSSGFFDSAFSTTAASAGGSFGLASTSDGGGSLTWANIVPTLESRRNGLVRVSAK
jgi:hypothetical protein